MTLTIQVLRPLNQRTWHIIPFQSDISVKELVEA